MADTARPDHPIDFNHLETYTLADGALEREVLALFAGHARETFARLLATDDPGEGGKLAHALKGSAKGVGAWQLAAAAEDLERGLSQGAMPDERDAQTVELGRRLEEACSYAERFAKDA